MSKSVETEKDKLHMQFSALNVDFLCSQKSAHEGIKERYPHKSRCFTNVGQSFVKTVMLSYAVMLPITTSTSDELFSRINIDDFERP